RTNGPPNDNHPTYTPPPASPATITHPVSIHAPSAGSSPAEIGFDDTLIRLDHAGRALGDLLAVVEHEHRFAQAHDDLHVVLDEQDGLALLAQAAPVPGQVVQQRPVRA